MTLPESIDIVPLRLFFPLTPETFYTLSLHPQLTEPILNGHPQSVYNTLVYPLKMILQNTTIENFWFDALNITMTGIYLPTCHICSSISLSIDPFTYFQSPTYVEEHFKKGTTIIHTRYIVPLFLAAREEKLIVYFHPLYLITTFASVFLESISCPRSPCTSLLSFGSLS